MFISGFTIIKNAVINDYPVVEAVTSILPVVDEMIVLAGDSKDDTIELIRSINDPKIKIHNSVWDKSLTKGGEALADETNKSFKLIDPQSDWAFYIQADEVLHEKYYSAVLEACKTHKDNILINGLLFKYLHFYGTYDYVGDSRKWYNHEVRIIKNDKRISAYKDAQGFRIGNKKLLVKPVDAYIYHYGWVKSPEQMKRKQNNVHQYWHGEEIKTTPEINEADYFNYNEFDSLTKFTGTHPEVMKNRIKQKNWHLQLDIKKKNFSFKYAFLYYLEKLTGKRIFDFKNYKKI